MIVTRSKPCCADWIDLRQYGERSELSDYPSRPAPAQEPTSRIETHGVSHVRCVACHPIAQHMITQRMIGRWYRNWKDVISLETQALVGKPDQTSAS